MDDAAISEQVLRERLLLERVGPHAILEHLSAAPDLSLGRLRNVAGVDRRDRRMGLEVLLVEALHVLLVLAERALMLVLLAPQHRGLHRVVFRHLRVIVARVRPRSLDQPQAPILVQIVPLNVLIQSELFD